MKVLEVHNYMESSMLGSWCNDDGYQYTISYTHICPVGMLGPWEWWYSKYPEVPNYVTIWYFCPCTLYGIAHNGILDIHRIRWFHAGNDENTIIDYGILKMDEYEWTWMSMDEYEWIWMNLIAYEWTWMNMADCHQSIKRDLYTHYKEHLFVAGWPYRICIYIYL